MACPRPKGCSDDQPKESRTIRGFRMISLVDSGGGNLRSIERALLQVGATPRVTSALDELAGANGLVLPGVGAFAPALGKLEQGNLGRWIVELARKGRPLLGVCLGY